MIPQSRWGWTHGALCRQQFPALGLMKCWPGGRGGRLPSGAAGQDGLDQSSLGNELLEVQGRAGWRGSLSG